MKKFLIIGNVCCIAFLAGITAIINARAFNHFEALTQHFPWSIYYKSGIKKCTNDMFDQFGRSLQLHGYLACDSKKSVSIGIDSRQKTKIYATHFLNMQKKICFGRVMISEINATLTNSDLVLISGTTYFQEVGKDIRSSTFFRVLRAGHPLVIGTGRLEVKTSGDGFEIVVTHADHGILGAVKAHEIDYYEDQIWYAEAKRFLLRDNLFHLLWSDELENSDKKYSTYSMLVYDGISSGKDLKEIGCDVGELVL